MKSNSLILIISLTALSSCFAFAYSLSDDITNLNQTQSIRNKRDASDIKASYELYQAINDMYNLTDYTKILKIASDVDKIRVKSPKFGEIELLDDLNNLLKKFNHSNQCIKDAKDYEEVSNKMDLDFIYLRKFIRKAEKYKAEKYKHKAEQICSESIYGIKHTSFLLEELLVENRIVNFLTNCVRSKSIEVNEWSKIVAFLTVKFMLIIKSCEEALDKSVNFFKDNLINKIEEIIDFYVKKNYLLFETEIDFVDQSKKMGKKLKFDIKYLSK